MDKTLSSTIFQVIGAVWLALNTWRAYRWVSFQFWPASNPLHKYRRPNGETWAFVTGSSAGIGLGFAEELASRGFNVVIHSYMKDELDAAEIRLKEIRSDVKIRKLLFDSMRYEVSDLEKMVGSVSDLPITILVNNVGGIPLPNTGDKIQPLLSQTLTELDDIINLNARFMIQLTRLIIPVLARRGGTSPSKSSLILNLSSAARHGAPYVAAYSGTKGFAWAFSMSLQSELRGESVPVDVLSLRCGDVATQGNNVNLPAAAPGPRKYAEMVLDRAEMAVTRHTTDIAPFWMHEVSDFLALSLPDFILQPAVVQRMQGMIIEARRRRDN